jgi:hypothetical protein
MDEAGTKRHRPDPAHEAQTQVRSRPRTRPHKACWPDCATLPAALAIWLGMGLACALAKGDASAAKAPPWVAAPLLNTTASAVNYLPPHLRRPSISASARTLSCSAAEALVASRHTSHSLIYPILPRSQALVPVPPPAPAPDPFEPDDDDLKEAESPPPPEPAAGAIHCSLVFKQSPGKPYF